MGAGECYQCFHSVVWTRQEHKDGVKKFCWLKWEDVDPNGTCGYYCWCFGAGYNGVTVRGIPAEPNGLYERVV